MLTAHLTFSVSPHRSARQHVQSSLYHHHRHLQPGQHLHPRLSGTVPDVPDVDGRHDEIISRVQSLLRLQVVTVIVIIQLQIYTSKNISKALMESKLMA